MVIPGVNDAHLPDVVRAVRRAGAFVVNLVPLISAPEHGTHFGRTGQRGPTPEELERVQAACEIDARLMRHCRQCRADAVGRLSEDRFAEFTLAALPAAPVQDESLFNNNPLAPVAVPNSAYYDKIDLDRSLAIYKEHFGDANGMHFTIVGSFKEAEIIPLIEKYLASLPATQKKFAYTDNKVRPVAGVKKLEVSKGKEQKSLILAFYTGEVPYSQDLALKTDAMSEVLNIRIIEELREKIQGIYGGGTFGGLEKIPYGNYTFSVQLPCGPEKVDTLIKAVQKEFDDIAAKGPEQSYLDKVKKQWIEKYRTSLKQNETWLRELQDMTQNTNDPKYFLDYESYVNKLTTKDVQQAAKLILKGKNQFTAVLMPEK